MNHNKRKISLILTLFMLVNMFIVPMQAYAMEYHSVSNDFVKMDVNSKTGWYTFGTREGNPEYITDNNKKLLYGNGDGRFTTYTTMKINDKLFEYGMSNHGSELVAEPTVKNNKSITVWQADGIEIKQIIEMVGLGNQEFEGTFKIRYEATNTKDYAQKLGSRIMMDTMLGNNDGAPIRTFDEAISKTKIYSDDDVPAFWQAFDSLSNPTIMAQGTIWSLDTNKPDHFVVDDWEYLSDNMWDVKGSRRIDDSAVAIFWDQESIEAHETKYFETYYGVANVKSSDGDTDEKVSVAVASEDKINITENGYSPNPFEVRAYISNNQTGQRVSGSKIKIKLPEGLKLIDGQVPVINLEPLVFGKIHTTLWQIIPEEVKEEKTYNYSIVYTDAAGDEIVVEKTVVVPALTDDVPVLQYVDVGVNTDNSSCDIHIFGRNYSLLDDLSLFKIKLVQQESQGVVELNSEGLKRLSDKELIISVSDLAIGHYDLVIDHPVFDSKRFQNAVLITSKQLAVNSISLASIADGEDVYSIGLSEQVATSAVIGKLQALENQGAFYHLDVTGLVNNSGGTSYKFDDSAVVNQIVLSDTTTGIRLSFAAKNMDDAIYTLDGNTIKVTLKGQKITTPEQVEQVEKVNEVVANQGETYAPETTQIPKVVKTLKVGVFELKGNFKESAHHLYEYESSGTVSIGNNIMYTGGKIYVDLDKDKITGENGTLYAPTPKGINIPLTIKGTNFDLVARDGESLKLKNVPDFGKFEVAIAEFEFDGVEVFEDSDGPGLVLKDLSISLGFEKLVNNNELKDELAFKIDEFKIHESGKLNLSFEVSASYDMKVDLKKVAALRGFSASLGFQDFRINKSSVGGKIELYCFKEKTFGANLGFDFDHWKFPYIDNFEFDIEYEKKAPQEIPVGPSIISLNQHNTKHRSHFPVLRKIKFEGEKMTTGSYSDPANFTGTVEMTDGVSPEIDNEYLLNIEGALNMSGQYAKISGNLGIYMFDLAEGEVALYWLPRAKFEVSGEVNIGGIVTGDTHIVVASNDVQFDVIGTVYIPRNVKWIGGKKLTEQQMTYDFNKCKFYTAYEVWSHGVGISLDVGPNVDLFNRLEFKFFGNKYQNIDNLLQEHLDDITPASFQYGTNIELLASYNSQDKKFFGSLDTSTTSGPATVVGGDNQQAVEKIVAIDVNKKYEGLVLDITYDENTSSDFILTLPNGDQYKLVQLSDNLSEYANYASEDGKAIMYIDPAQGEDYLAQGTYKLTANGTDDFDVNMSYIKPLLSIDKLEVAETASGQYDVNFGITQEVQSTTSAAVTFYVSAEKDVYAGQKVKEVSLKDSADQSFSLDLSTIDDLTEETYYLYAKLEKESRVPDRKFAESTLTFINNKLPQAPNVLTAQAGNGNVEVVFENANNDHVKEYFVGVLKENGDFDFTKSYARIINQANISQFTARIEGLELDKDYQVAVLSVATYETKEESEYIGKPSLSKSVHLHTPQIPTLTVEFEGVEGSVKVNEILGITNEYLSNTLLVKANLENSDGAMVVISVNDEEVMTSEENAIVSTLLLKEGFNKIKFKAKNAIGDTNEYSYDLNVDTVKPFVTVDNYSSFVLVDSTELVVTGEAEVVSKLSINGNGVTITENGTYNETVALPFMSNVIEVNLEDAAGNVSSLSFEAKRQLTDAIQSVVIENAKINAKANELIGESVYLVDASNEKIKVNTEDIQWKISNEAVFSVNDQGKLLAKSLGQATVSAGFALSQNNVIWSPSITIKVDNSGKDNEPPTPTTPSSNSSRRSDRDDSKSSTSAVSSTSKDGNFEKMISQTGGKVVLDDVTINIPNHLIEGNTLLTLTNETNGIEIGNRTQVSDYYNIGLGEFKFFDKNITIELPLNDSFSDENCAAYYYNESRDKWLYIGGQVDRENKTISFDVNHLTCFTVLEADDLCTFSDVENRWSEAYVRRLVGLGIVNGVSDSTFAPKREISRAEFMTMLYRALELKDTATELPFEDASTIPTYAQDAVKALYISGLVKGSKGADNQIYIDAGVEITRAEVCKLVYDYLSSTGYNYKEPSNFDDALPKWSEEAIKSLSSIQIVSGYEDGSFKAGNPITREEAAKIIYVMLEKLHI